MSMSEQLRKGQSDGAEANDMTVEDMVERCPPLIKS